MYLFFGIEERAPLFKRECVFFVGFFGSLVLLEKFLIPDYCLKKCISSFIAISAENVRIIIFLTRLAQNCSATELFKATELWTWKLHVKSKFCGLPFYPEYNSVSIIRIRLQKVINCSYKILWPIRGIFSIVI